MTPLTKTIMLTFFALLAAVGLASPHHEVLEQYQNGLTTASIPLWHNKDGAEIKEMWFEASLIGYDGPDCARDTVTYANGTTTFHAVNGWNCIELNSPVQSFLVDAM